MKKALIIPFLLTLACQQKGPDYWIQPKNQNGNLFGFYATPEYCSMLVETCIECHSFVQINDSISNYLATKKVQDHVLKATQSIEKLYNQMVWHCAGYCEGYEGLYPILPYRKASVNEFWTDSQNSDSLVNALQGFDLSTLDPDKETLSEGINNVEIVNEFLLNENTITAMINLKMIQLAILKNADNQSSNGNAPQQSDMDK